jgi:hypothetical protein
MEQQRILSLRPFVGAKDFALSRRFYHDFGFAESVLAPRLSYFSTQGFGFYLQDAYVPDWVDNTMLFLEVGDVEAYWTTLQARDLPGRYPGVKVSAIREEAWGKEGFVHDPAGILWHIGEFRTP